MTESGDRIISWYETKGYDFSNKDFLEAMKSKDDIKGEIKTLKEFAEEPPKNKKPFSKGQKKAFMDVIDSEEVQGKFERNLSKRELQEQIRAEEYTTEVKRIKGLQQISAAEEFKTEYKDIKESIEIQNASKVRGIVKQEIVEMMAKARAEKEAEKYTPEKIEVGIISGIEQGITSPSQLLSLNLQSEDYRNKSPKYQRWATFVEERLEEQERLKQAKREAREIRYQE